MINGRVNRQILEIWNNWNKYFPGENPQIGPLFFDNFKKNCILFIGLNPSFSQKASKRIYKWRMRKKLGEVEWVNQCVNADKYHVEKHPYFHQFRKFAREINMEWEHIDLFFYKETSQKTFRKVIYENGELTQFANDQLKISLELIKSINPRVIIVANALASEIIREKLDQDIGKLDKRKGFHTFPLSRRRVPIFFSSMWTGQRALDRWSLERLKWHIRKSIS